MFIDEHIQTTYFGIGKQYHGGYGKSEKRAKYEKKQYNANTDCSVI